jgi:hypothetical protein
MRFRYLIAVPFTSHGSRVLKYIESEINGERKTQVLPYEPISMWDFILLRQAFEQIPCFIGLEPMSFYFDNAWVSYERAPDIIEFERIVDTELMATWIAHREESKKIVYAEVKKLAAALSQKSKKQLSASVERFYTNVPRVLSPLMLSTFVDEPLFEQYRLITELIPANLREQIQALVFSSPYTVAWGKEDLALTLHKRILNNWKGDFYVARMHKSTLDSVEKSYLKFMDSLTNSSIYDVIAHRLWTIHIIVQCSEELHYLWGSVATLLSTAISIVGADVAPFLAIQSNEGRRER